MSVFNPVSTRQADDIRSLYIKSKQKANTYYICISIDNESSESH